MTEKGEDGGLGDLVSHCISVNELSGSISLANGKGRTQDEMTGRANQLEMMESGNSQYIRLESPTWRRQEVQKAGQSDSIFHQR